MGIFVIHMAVALRIILVALAVVASLALIIGIVIWQTSDDTGPDAGTPNATNGKIRGRFGLDELGGKDQPRDGTQFPVGKEELYLNYATRDKALDQLIETDYDCRYSQFSQNCYCCGAFFHFTEQVLYLENNSPWQPSRMIRIFIEKSL